MNYCITNKQYYINEYNSIKFIINNLEYYFNSNFINTSSSNDVTKLYNNYLSLKQQFLQLPLPENVNECCKNSKFIELNNNVPVCGCESNSEPYYTDDGTLKCNYSYGCITNSYNTKKTGKIINDKLICDCSSNSIWSNRYNTCIQYNLNSLNNIETNLSGIVGKINSGKINISQPYFI